MNFIEMIKALADGKHKARRDNPHWLQHNNWWIRLANADDGFCYTVLRAHVLLDGSEIILQEEDYLAEDWVVEEI